MAGIAHNLVTRPRFDSSTVGPWKAYSSAATISVGSRAGAGLDLESNELRAASTHGGLYYELPDTWEPGARYRIDATVYVRNESRTAVVICHRYVTGFRRPYPTGDQSGLPIPDWCLVSEELSPAGWARITGTIELGDYYRDDEGDKMTPYLGDRIAVGVVQWDGTKDQELGISHITVVRETESDGDPGGYWDGNGRAPTDPDPPADTGVYYTWGGDPFGSPSIAAVTGGGGDPDPDPDPDPLTIVDPEGLLVGTVGDPILPYTLEANRDPVSWSATGLPDGLTIGEGDGTITGTPTTAGTGDLTVRADDGDDYDELVVPFDIADTEPDPDPEPEPDGWDELDQLAEQLAPRVAAWLDSPGDEDTLTHARAVLPVVAAYVHGYTRGAGWDGTDGMFGRPVMPLQVVIVSAAGRVVSNPEQVSYYSAGDYSERPAVLAGWTLAELGVLRRYRKVRG